MTPERLSQIQELYHSARERDLSQRTAFLVAACKDDEDLLREVESLLAADPSDKCFLDEPLMRQASGLLSGQTGGDYRFQPGQELGPYIIEARLGAGGMGEVYRAKDKRLRRTVALKVLPERLAHTPGLRQRLEREAKAISSLNHPRICTLYDIGREGEVDYLVMEFLEGETLAQRLKRGALPISEALELAIQIASGLAAAHSAGIVHRDLTPGNIMLTKSGVKLLDFGLAKAPATVAATPLADDGQAEPITAPGMVVGTVQYMSPEQIQGHEADARSDLFAFGATFYEILTGKKAFAGKSQIAVASAILEQDPDPVGNWQPRTPPALERVVRRCLAKDPENRWQNAGDLASELRWIADESGTPVATAGSAAVVKGRGRGLLYRALAAIFLLAAILSAVLYWHPARTPSRVITAEITPPGRVRFNLSALGGEPALSPDGRAVAFSGTDESGKTLLWVRALDSLEARALAGTEGAADPFWSPDGRKLGFFAGGKLKSVEASGGQAVVLAGGHLDNAGGSWNRDGTILLVPDVLNGVYKVTAAGGNPLPVVTDIHRSRFFGHPRFLPDGKHFLYVSGGNDPASRGTYFASLDGKENRLIMAGGAFAIYASGFLLYLSEDSLMAQPFDPERGKLSYNPPRRVANHVARSADLLHCTFDASENGVLVYGSMAQTNEKRLMWFDRAGKNQGSTGESDDYFDVRLSADGRKLASNVGSPNSDIWVDDLGRGVRTRLTMDPDIDSGVPVWSPDGNRIAFAVWKGKVGNAIYQKYSNGAGGEELLLAGSAPRGVWPTSWSRDGRFILYSSEADRRDGIDIWVLPLVGERRPRPFVQAAARAYDGQFSPDGRWVAYVSEESGRAEVYVVPFEAQRFLRAGASLARAGRNDRWQVSSGGGRCPRWRSDGKEIFYLSQTDQMMAAEVEEKSAGLVVGSAQALFRCALNGSITPSLEYYDVSPDGKKFVVDSYGDDHPTLILLVNWMANLK